MSPSGVREEASDSNPLQATSSADAQQAEIQQLLRRCLGVQATSIQKIEAGIGSRRFYRLTLETAQGLPPTLIARVEAPEDPALRPAGVPPEPSLEPLRSFLEAEGFPVPASFGRDPNAGIELLEDAGVESLETAALRLESDARRQLYAQACALVPRLQRLDAEPGRIPAFGRHLDSALFTYKAEQFIEWCLPWGLARSPNRAEAEAVRGAFSLVAEECAAAPSRLSHRDFKAANLLLPPGSPAERPLLMIDIQGAFLAPPEYDLVCLLRDAHVVLPEDEVERHLREVRPALPDAPEPGQFARRFTLLTLTRNGKDLARYLYAARRRGDERYLRLLPNAVAALRRAAAAAAGWDARLMRLAELIEQLPREEEAACAR